MSSNTVPDFLIGTIDRATLESAPFDHICFQAFAPEAYSTLLANLPGTERYLGLRHRDAMRPDGQSSRRRLFLYPETLVFLASRQRRHWLSLSRMMRSPALQDAFKRKFRDALERRFGRPIAELSFRPVPILVRDLAGYRIAVHADSPRKAITVQFYLPRDMSQSHLGTHFHYGAQGDAAERVKVLNFAPASAYAFPVVGEKSWHSVPPTNEADGARDSLMLTYYVRGSLRQRIRFWVGRGRECLAHLLGASLSPLP